MRLPKQSAMLGGGYNSFQQTKRESSNGKATF
jgi:hypothetical protein